MICICTSDSRLIPLVSERAMKNAVKNSLAILVRTSMLFFLLIGFAAAQPPTAAAPAPVRALIVVAHPDDESCFAATVYEITHNLGGTVDQLVITNGEGGYRYSLLAESYYGVALTDEAVGRAALPEIRKRELLEAGHILGVANHFFLDERDVRYTQDIDEVLNEHWHPGVVLPEVERRIAEGHYDFVFTLFPSPMTHGGHKAATITALSAVQTVHWQQACCSCLSGQPQRRPDAAILEGVPERKASLQRAAAGLCDRSQCKVRFQERARLPDHRELGDRRPKITGIIPNWNEPRRPRRICDSGKRRTR